MKFAQRSPLKSISRLTSTLCGLSFFMTATLVHADVMLIAPEEIDVVAINDKKSVVAYLAPVKIAISLMQAYTIFQCVTNNYSNTALVNMMY